MKHFFCIGFFLLAAPYFVFSADYNVLDYGALADGKTLNTIAIQSAIDKANSDGGGRVIIPSGRFLSGSIVLKSNVELYLEKKAVLLGSTNPEDYLKINRWKGLVMADGAKNIAISGKGTLDGQGARLALHIDSLFYIGKIDSNDYNFVEKRPKYYLRPQVIEFVNSRKIRVTGVTIKNSACWVQTYDLCRDIIIDNIRVESDAYWNNDGIDLVDCKNVRLTNSYFNAADDGICLKSSIPNNRIGETKTYRIINYCDSIYIANCIVRSSASAVKLGTRSVGGFKNITIQNIKVFDTFRSAIALELVDGGIMENILVENIKAKNTGNALFIRLGHRFKRNESEGQIKNITIRNVSAKIAFERPDSDYEMRGPALPFFHNVFPSSITGIPGYIIEDVKLENIRIEYPGRGNQAYASMPVSRIEEVPEQENHYPEFSMFGELPAWGFYVRHMNGLSMKNIRIKIKKPDYRPAMVFDDVKNLSIESLEISGDKKADPIILNNVEGAQIEE